MITCSKCLESKEDIEFAKGRRQCKSCRNLYHSERRKNKPREYFGNYVKTRYGITLEQYEKCMATSKKCEICGDTNNLHYDHNHVTNNFRGVLCAQCNSGLGRFKDNIELFKHATNYLLDRGAYG